MTGGEYDSNRPSSQLWIHMTAWHSILYVYEKYGPGKLSRSDENEYWRECAIAAQFLPIGIDDVARTRGEVQKYFDDWRDRLASSEAAMYNIDFILDGMRTVFTALPAPMRLVLGPFVRAGVVATYPRWMRSMMGVRQSPVTDALASAAIRPAMAALARGPRAQVWFLNRIAISGGWTQNRRVSTRRRRRVRSSVTPAVRSSNTLTCSPPGSRVPLPRRTSTIIGTTYWSSPHQRRRQADRRRLKA